MESGFESAVAPPQAVAIGQRPTSAQVAQLFDRFFKRAGVTTVGVRERWSKQLLAKEPGIKEHWNGRGGIRRNEYTQLLDDGCIRFCSYYVSSVNSRNFVYLLPAPYPRASAIAAVEGHKKRAAEQAELWAKRRNSSGVDLTQTQPQPYNPQAQAQAQRAADRAQGQAAARARVQAQVLRVPPPPKFQPFTNKHNPINLTLTEHTVIARNFATQLLPLFDDTLDPQPLNYQHIQHQQQQHQSADDEQPMDNPQLLRSADDEQQEPEQKQHQPEQKQQQPEQKQRSQSQKKRKKQSEQQRRIDAGFIRSAQIRAAAAVASSAAALGVSPAAGLGASSGAVLNASPAAALRSSSVGALGASSVAAVGASPVGAISGVSASMDISGISARVSAIDGVSAVSAVSGAGDAVDDFIAAHGTEEDIDVGDIQRSVTPVSQQMRPSMSLTPIPAPATSPDIMFYSNMNKQKKRRRKKKRAAAPTASTEDPEYVPNTPINIPHKKHRTRKTTHLRRYKARVRDLRTQFVESMTQPMTQPIDLTQETADRRLRRKPFTLKPEKKRIPPQLNFFPILPN